MRIEGSVVVVTGAAHGIGEAIAHAVARQGAAAVAVIDLDGPGAEAVARAVGETGVATAARQVDVTASAAYADVLTELEDALGPIDVMISNAGIGTGVGLEADDATWERAWAVNVQAHVTAARTLLPGMLERGRGAFVHTCSAAGLLTMIGDAPYSVTKHAAVAFAEWLAVTYGQRGIQVSALCPQGVETDLLRTGAGDVAEAVVRRAGVVLTPAEVADAVVNALDDGRFLVLPHAEVGELYRRKADDPQRWIAGMQRLAESVAATPGHSGG